MKMKGPLPFCLLLRVFSYLIMQYFMDGEEATFIKQKIGDHTSSIAHRITMGTYDWDITRGFCLSKVDTIFCMALIA